MALFWKAPIHKTVSLLETSGKRELFWYGVTIGQIGFGILASEKRQPTQRAADVCPECIGTGRYPIGSNETNCSACAGTGKRR